MAIAEEVDIQHFNILRQRDARDPLGIWVARLGVTGDATGGSIKVGINVPAANRAAHVYFCYDVNFATLTITFNNALTKVRLLTNWPDADPSVVGIQGYGSLGVYATAADAQFTAPTVGFTIPVIGAAQRFIPLWTTIGSGLTIVEIEHGDNVDTATYSFECFGYYFDHAVRDAPGGPRHPGSD